MIYLYIYLGGYFVTVILVTFLMRKEKGWSFLAAQGAGMIWFLLPILFLLTKDD